MFRVLRKREGLNSCTIFPTILLKKQRVLRMLYQGIVNCNIRQEFFFFLLHTFFFPSFCIGGVFHIFVLEVLKFVNPIQYYNYSSLCVYFFVPVLPLFCISHDRLVIPIAEESHSADVVGH